MQGAPATLECKMCNARLSGIRSRPGCSDLEQARAKTRVLEPTTWSMSASQVQIYQFGPVSCEFCLKGREGGDLDEKAKPASKGTPAQQRSV